MVIGILKEPSFESRVSMLAAEVAALTKSGQVVWVEKDAGLRAFCVDEDYRASGAEIRSRNEILKEADILLGIHGDCLSAAKNKTFIGVYSPLYHLEEIDGWAQQGNTVFSLDLLPRTTRAQSMDVLSSQASIAGYKAALMAACTYARYFPMMMTAAGSIAPAKVLIIGAGVAGLQAVATCRKLGSVVEVFDTRPAAKEEVLSLGAKFVEVEGAADASKAGGYAVDQSAEFKERQKQRIAESIKKADIVITTAQIFGKKAPVVITKEMITTMRAGSLIIDLAAATGGNTEVTKDNAEVVAGNVTIIGNSNLAAAMPSDASKLYGRNVLNFLKLLISKDGSLELNLADDIISSACVIKGEEVISPIVKKNMVHGNVTQLHPEQY
ncbi:MAG: NAD(P) transhydrogenase subunit alpha [Bacteroidetes bacterium]|nr:NAD(P) transhydrogenase subunit alpha [Bacteroidota bacterium]